MKGSLVGSLTVFCIIILAGTGCKKKESALKDESPVKEQAADTSVKKVEPFKDVDTSKEAVFTEADLDAEFAKKVKENMKPVYFEFGDYTISDEYTQELSNAASFLEKESRIRVLISGHCDERGTAEYNMVLGEKRAKAVKEFLVDYGIDPIRMEITSYGEEKPAEPNCSSEECYSKNRRAEFSVLSE